MSQTQEYTKDSITEVDSKVINQAEESTSDSAECENTTITSQSLETTLNSIEVETSTADVVARIKELVELIQPVTDVDKLSEIIWAIVKACNHSAGYLDIAHKFAMKSLGSGYSVTAVAEIIKLTRQNGTGFAEKFLSSQAKIDNPIEHSRWLAKYKTRKISVKAAGPIDQKLSNPKLADLVIDGFDGKASIFYYQGEWYQWVEYDKDGRVMLWVNREVKEIVGMMSITTEAALIKRGFTQDNVVKYSDSSSIGKALGIIQVEVTMKKWPQTAAWDLPIKNGLVLNLKTGKVRHRTHNDYFTFECDIDLSLVSTAGLERVAEFFRTTSWGQGQGFQEWLLNHCLYCLSGELDDSRPNVLTMEGIGRNGKGTLINTIARVLGGYGCSLPPSVIFDRDDQGRAHETALLRLNGRRCVIFSETGDKPINMQTLKRITGGDILTGRGANERKFIDFESVAKILIVAKNTLNLDFDDNISKRVTCFRVKAQFVEPRLVDETRGMFATTDIKKWLSTPEGLACFVDFVVKYGQPDVAIPVPEIPRAITGSTDINNIQNHELYTETRLRFDNSGALSLDQIYRSYEEWLQGVPPSMNKTNFAIYIKTKFPGVYHNRAHRRVYRLAFR